MAGTGHGPLGVVDMGAHSLTQEYKYLHEVTEDGSTYRYIALAPSTGKPLPVHPATSTTYWRLTARAGRDGVDGVDGVDGKDGQLLYATFDIDDETGDLVMYTPDGYAGPQFVLNEETGDLEVHI